MEEQTTAKIMELEKAHGAKVREFEAMKQRLKLSERMKCAHDEKMEELKQEIAAMTRDHAQCLKSHVVCCWLLFVGSIFLHFDLLTTRHFTDNSFVRFSDHML